MSKNSFQSIEVDQLKKSGYPIDLKKNELLIRELKDYKKFPGWMIRDESIREWRFEGLKNGSPALFYGPEFKGKSLLDILKLPSAKALPSLLKILGAFELLSREIRDNISFELDSVYLAKDGTVLVLPPLFFEILRKEYGIHPKLTNFDFIHQPYLDFRKGGMVFSFGVLLYRVFTGVFPFEGENEEEVRRRIRNFAVMPPRLLNTEIRKDCSNYLEKFFNRKTYSQMSAKDLRDIILKWQEIGVHQEISGGDKDRLLKESAKKHLKSEKRYKTRFFLEKHMNQILTISLVSVAVIVFIGSYVGNLLKPKVTKGFTPSLVVETYYNSIDKLDHMTMSDCVFGNAGKDDIDQIIPIYVMIKQAAAYSHQTNIILADAWLKITNRQDFSNALIFGITDLLIRPLTNDGQPAYLVRYVKWQPKNESESNFIIERRLTEDKVAMTNAKGYWLISDIQRSSKLLSGTNR